MGNINPGFSPCGGQVISHPLSPANSQHANSSDDEVLLSTPASSELTVTPEQNNTTCSLSIHCPITPRDTASARARITNLVQSQADQQPLPMLENLARENRQIAVRAAVIASKMSMNFVFENQLTAYLKNPLQESHHLIKTGEDSVLRASVQNAYSEPKFRIVTESMANLKASSNDSTGFVGSKSKAEVVVNKLLSVLSAEQPQVVLTNFIEVDLLSHREGYDPTLTQVQSDSVPMDIAQGTTFSFNQIQEDILDLASYVNDHHHLLYADFIEQIATRSPELAIFFSFCEHALLIKDSLKEGKRPAHPPVNSSSLQPHCVLRQFRSDTVINSEREQVWTERIAQWRDSGKSQRAYAIEHGVEPRQFCYWVQRLAKTPPPTEATSHALPALMPVRVAPALTNAAAMTLRSEHGWMLSLPAGVPATWLAELMRAL